MKIEKEQIDEMRALLEGGDLNLNERRAVFAKVTGRTTILDDEKLLAACAATDDDDDDLFVDNVKKVEDGTIEIAA